MSLWGEFRVLNSLERLAMLILGQRQNTWRWVSLDLTGFSWLEQFPFEFSGASSGWLGERFGRGGGGRIIKLRCRVSVCFLYQMVPNHHWGWTAEISQGRGNEQRGSVCIFISLVCEIRHYLLACPVPTGQKQNLAHLVRDEVSF